MEDITRRVVLSAGVGLGIGLTSTPTQAEGDREIQADAKRDDRGRVIACGMTEAEADCWEAIARAAGLFFELPDLHPMDKQEVATAIHVVQNKLLGRPVYRRYKELTIADGKAAKK